METVINITTQASVGSYYHSDSVPDDRFNVILYLYL